MIKSFRIWLNVVNAILIRDVKVRSGPYFTGYIFVFLLPFLHLFGVVIGFSIFGRVAPIGTDNVVYFGLSILPFVIFRYPTHQIMISISSNAPLLYFSRVKLQDIVTARGSLEIINGLMVCALVLTMLSVWAGGGHPEHPLLMIYSLLCTLFFGFAIGGLNALIGQIFPMWIVVFGVMYIILYIGSGIVYYPHSIPEPYFYYQSYNPLLICIESLRFSYYFGYPDVFVKLDYVLILSIFILVSNLVLERIGRRLLLAG